MGGGAHSFAGGGATGSPTLMWFAESRVRVWLYRRPTDMRRSFDGLSAMVKRELGEEPTSGALYVFVNRRKTLMKVLYFERSGYCVWSKRLEQGQFQVRWGGSTPVRCVGSLIQYSDGHCQTNWVGPEEFTIEGSQAASWHHSARAAARACLKIWRRLRWRWWLKWL